MTAKVMTMMIKGKKVPSDGRAVARERYADGGSAWPSDDSGKIEHDKIIAPAAMDGLKLFGKAKGGGVSMPKLPKTDLPSMPMSNKLTGFKKMKGL